VIRRADVLLLLAVPCAIAGCLPVATWNPATRGRVVERATGAPVAGALVVTDYPMKGLGTSGSDIGGSAVTNADGRFFIPGRPSFLLLMPMLGKQFLPDFAVYYPVYDYVQAESHATGFNSYRIEVELVDTWARPAGDPRAPHAKDGSCLHGGDLSGDSICRQICEHVYGRPCQHTDW
jgi:hypothetical protein